MATKKSQENATVGNTTVGTPETLIDQYKKPFMYGLGIIIALIAAIFAYNSYSENRNQVVSEAMFRGQEYFAADNFEKALNGDGQGFEGFLKIAEENGSTDAGNLAKLYAGMSYAQTGKYEEAVKFLEDFDACDDNIITPSAIAMLGNCYAQLGNNEKAAKTLVKAAKMADNATLSPFYWMQAGEIYEAMGKNDEALDCYEEIKENYVNSMQYNEIEKYIERLSK